MKITYNYTIGDYICFIWQHQIRSLPNLILGCVATFFAVWVSFGQYLKNERPVVAVIFFALISAIVFVAIFIFNFAVTILMILSKKNKVLYTETTIDLCEDMIIEENKYGRSEFKWEIVQKVLRTPKYTYIYIAQLRAFVIPKRSFQTRQEWDACNQFIRSHSHV